MRFFEKPMRPFAWRKRKHVKRVKGLDNPLAKKVQMLQQAIPSWDRFFETSVADRTYDWDEIDELFDPLCDYYSWAIPDERALNIVSEFSPLIEIGCGNGYWAALLQNRGVDIVPFDVYASPRKCWTTVFHGGPEILGHKYAKNRSLFLCYPDEAESIAYECLEAFQGDYIVYVGEMFTTGTLGGAPQAPYGRTASSDFQVRGGWLRADCTLFSSLSSDSRRPHTHMLPDQVALVSSFHCLLVRALAGIGRFLLLLRAV
jgi:hypothetical protein